MPNWKKLVVSGSDAALNSLSITGTLTGSIVSASSGFTGSLFGTSSWAANAVTASTADNFTVRNNLIVSGSGGQIPFQVLTGSAAPILFITSSGRIGVYTTTPGVTFDVVGDMRARDNMYTSHTVTNIIRANTRNMVFQTGSAETTVVATMFTSSGNFVFQSAQSATDLGYRMAINGASTSGSLYVSGSTVLNGDLIVSGNTTIGDANTDTITLNANTINLGTGNTGILNIDNGTLYVDGANNKIRIPTISGSTIFTGTTTINNTDGINDALLTVSSSVTSSILISTAGGTTNGIQFQNAGSPTSRVQMRAYSASVETIRIDSVGGSFINSLTVTGSLNVSAGITASLQGTSSWANNALTSSYINTLNQSVVISGSSLSILPSPSNTSEQVLIVGAASGSKEGGQIMLLAPADFPSASMIDNYTNYTRLLRGSNNGSDAIVAQWNMHTKQMELPAYNSSTAFTGTVAGYLAFDSSGRIITSSGSSGGGAGSGTVNNGTAGYLAYYPSTGTTVDDTSGVYWDAGTSRLAVGNASPAYKVDVSGDIRSTGAVYANANNTMYFRGGDDAEFWDINVTNTVGIYGQQTQSVASIKLGSSGGTISGKSGSIGIGTINPDLGTLQVNGNVYATSFTGSFSGSVFGYVANTSTSSFILNSQTGSFATTGSNTFIGNQNVTGSITITGSLNITGSEVMSSGFMRIGGAPASFAVPASNNYHQLIVQGPEGNRDGDIAVYETTTNSTNGGSITMYRSRAGNAVTNSMVIGELDFWGAYDSVPTFNKVANITARSLPTSVYTATSTPGRIVFGTVPSGSTTLYDRFIIEHDGTIIVSQSLQVTGSLNANNITGSLLGTASWARNALTSSYVNPLNQNVTITGSLTLYTGSSAGDNSLLIKDAGNLTTKLAAGYITVTVDNQNYILQGGAGIVGSTISFPDSANATMVLYINNEGADQYGNITLTTIPTASYVNTLKAGSGSAASFGGSPRTASFSLTSPYSNNNYAVTVTGEDARTWTIQSKTSGSFTINSNSSVALTGPVYWIATPFNL